MEYELYVIYDAAKNLYFPPTAQENDATAMRSFAHECMNPDSIWHTHPSDFVMYKVGIFYSNTGEIIALDRPERICSGTDFVGKDK